MAKMIYVRAVKGVVCPYPGYPGRFIGYRQANKAEVKEAKDGQRQFDHVVPDGKSYVLRDEPEMVVATLPVVKALRNGELREAPAPAPKAVELPVVPVSEPVRPRRGKVAEEKE